MNNIRKYKNSAGRLSSLCLVFISFLILFGFSNKGLAAVNEANEFNELKLAESSFITNAHKTNIIEFKDLHNNIPFPISSPVCPEPNPKDSEDDQDEKENEGKVGVEFLSLNSIYLLPGSFSNLVHLNHLHRSIQNRKKLPLYSLFQSWKLYLV